MREVTRETVSFGSERRDFRSFDCSDVISDQKSLVQITLLRCFLKLLVEQNENMILKRLSYFRIAFSSNDEKLLMHVRIFLLLCFF